MSAAKAGRALVSGYGRTATVAGVGALVIALIPAAGAGAATIHVRDNKADAIQKGINRAVNGDKLLIHRGHYTEDVVVDKRLRLIGASKKRRPVIDGQCQSDEVVDLAHNGIKLRRLKVIGAAEETQYGYNINIIALDRATIEKVTVKETCNGPDSALYGINVYRGGAIEIRNVRAFGGFHDAGIYVGGIIDTSPGPLVVAHNEAYGNNVGIRMEEVIASTDVRVRANLTHHNDVPQNPGFEPPAGIFSNKADGILYEDNVSRRNDAHGIRLDPESENNVFVTNVSRKNDVFDVFNQGGGSNCGTMNVFGSLQGQSINAPC